MTATQTAEGLLYHVFPLGLHGASHDSREAVLRGHNIREFADWIPHLVELGTNAVLFGPVLHSSSHGYDSIDLYSVDPRLGTNQDFAELCDQLHQNDIAVVMDAVFNHSGRDFFAFQDLIHKGENSTYRHWYSGLDFSQEGPMGDGFAYECWDGHPSLPKFNLRNPELRSYLFSALELWIRDFGIDGLRMDAADVIDPYLWPLLRAHGDLNYRPRRPLSFNKGRFWLMGEMVFGDYSDICREGMLDSVTNYELYKGLYSSHNDGNYYELAWTLNRQFGSQGIYRGKKLYNFVDNHDVDRIANRLDDRAHMYPLHILLFTVPGLPSLYYGSETGYPGAKGSNDWELRPRIHIDTMPAAGRHADLPRTITALRQIRSANPALQDGSYRQVFVDHRQFAFLRESGNQVILIIVNSEDASRELTIENPSPGTRKWVDLLNRGQAFEVGDDRSIRMDIPSNWGRILLAE